MASLIAFVKLNILSPDLVKLGVECSGQIYQHLVKEGNFLILMKVSSPLKGHDAVQSRRLVRAQPLKVANRSSDTLNELIMLSAS